MNNSISVLLAVKDEEKHISRCLESLLDQTHQDFEIVIVDDASTDNTSNIIKKFDDERIKYFKNKKWLGVAKSRNKCIRLSKGDHVFFTDGDCIVAKDWVEQGIRCLKEPNCVGVEGKTYYVSEEYNPTYSDRVIENITGGEFLTCNIAFKRSVIESVGGFDVSYIYTEDRDLALRAKKHGKIHFHPKMIVYHQKKTWKPKQFVKSGKRMRDQVLLFKKFREEEEDRLWRIIYPKKLMALIFPPLMFSNFFRCRFKTKEDFNLFPFAYIKLIYERLNLWEMCAKKRTFLI